MKEVRKYFMAGTDEEVLIGDLINVELEKDFGDGRTLTRNLEFKLTEESIPGALEMGIIEEGNEKEDDLIDFDDKDFIPRSEFQEFSKCVAEDIEKLAEDYRQLDKRVGKFEEKVVTLLELYKLQQPSKSSSKASSRKK